MGQTTDVTPVPAAVTLTPTELLHEIIAKFEVDEPKAVKDIVAAILEKLHISHKAG